MTAFLRARGAAIVAGALLGVTAACRRPPPEIHPDTVAPSVSVVSLASAALSSPSSAGARRVEAPASSSASALASASASAVRDAGRVTSKSGRLVAFVRDENEIWLGAAGAERKVVSGDALVVENPKANLPPLANTGFANLAFSPDEKRLYFMKPGWATSWALFYVEVDTGKVFFFHDANGYQLITECKDRAQIGRVITYEHSYFDINPSSATDMFFLVDAAPPAPGERRTGGSARRGLIGYEENILRFLALTCGLGQAPPVVPQIVPAKFRRDPVRCNSLTLRRDDLHFLDGTTLVRWRLVARADESVMMYDIQDIGEICAKP